MKRRVLAYLEPGERRSTEEIAAATESEVEDVRPVLSWMRDKGFLEAVATHTATRAPCPIEGRALGADGGLARASAGSSASIHSSH